MVQIQQDHAIADETKHIVAKEEEEASRKAAETQALKDDAQRDLDEALPALEEAVECVKKLKSDHIREVKVLTKPPAGVVLTMEAVCIMFGVGGSGAPTYQCSSLRCSAALRWRPLRGAACCASN